MKTIFQKDLRENLKLALIGLLIFSLLLIQAYQSSITALTNLLKTNGSITTSTLQPLLSQTLLTEVAFFCAIFAAGLGWLQTRNEAHRDLWAFLIHRPVSRAEIFHGKAAAGLCLYALGAGLPLLVLILVVQTPGHVAAPFEWAMTLMPLAILLSGVRVIVHSNGAATWPGVIATANKIASGKPAPNKYRHSPAAALPRKISVRVTGR